MSGYSFDGDDGSRAVQETMEEIFGQIRRAELASMTTEERAADDARVKADQEQVEQLMRIACPLLFVIGILCIVIDTQHATFGRLIAGLVLAWSCGIISIVMIGIWLFEKWESRKEQKNSGG